MIYIAIKITEEKEQVKASRALDKLVKYEEEGFRIFKRVIICSSGESRTNKEINKVVVLFETEDGLVDVQTVLVYDSLLRDEMQRVRDSKELTYNHRQLLKAVSKYLDVAQNRVGYTLFMRKTNIHDYAKEHNINPCLKRKVHLIEAKVEI